jgi:hypothetical protein
MAKTKKVLRDIHFPVEHGWEEGDVVFFSYAAGNHPDEPRELHIENVYDNGNIGGKEFEIAKGEYRQFNPEHMYDVEIEVEVEAEDCPAPVSLAEAISVEDHELAMFRIVLEKILEKLPN